MNDFKSEPHALKSSIKDAITRVVDSGHYVLGEEVETFESAWARMCNAHFAVGVGNGMDAIEISLRALGVGPGDEVITSSMTAFASVLAIIRAGAVPVLADIEMNTALLSLASAERCLTKKTKAILLIHLYGQVNQMTAWQDFCNANKLYLIEDCAQSHLASWQGQIAGSFGKAGAYSFYPTKNLGAYGDAGAIITNDAELEEKAKRLRNYGQSVRYYHTDIGLNSRLDEIQAAILSERLKWLSKFNQRRREIAQNYNNQIENPLINLMAEPQEPSSHVYHLYVIASDNRAALMKHLADQGIQSLIHYPVPIHLQAACSYITRDPKGLSISELHAHTCLSIPCHPQMINNDVFKVIEVINSFRDI
jgi:dTDP-4-amino-4,6-dideoxygalactose transaminase